MSAICPYCFSRMETKAAVFRCMNPKQDKCKPALDEPLAAYKDIRPILEPRTLLVPVDWYRAMPTEAKCECGYLTVKRICPECHNALTPQFDSLKNVTIGLLGAKGSGKSNYIGVLIDRLRNEVSTAFHASLNALDGMTTKRYQDDYRKPLFQERAVIAPTASSKTEVTSRYPLSYSFSLQAQNAIQRGKALSLSLFDTAGEDLNDDDTITTHIRYIGSAKGLIFLLDPQQLPGVRDLLPPSRFRNDLTDPSEIIDRIVGKLRLVHKVRNAKKIPVPVAVVFSKIDLVRTLMDRDSPLSRVSAHKGLYDDVDGKAVHESIRSHLIEWGAQAIDNTLATHFSCYRFFGVSSFGYQPAGDVLNQGIQPFRVEDPFLWLLSQFGIIGHNKPGGKG